MKLLSVSDAVVLAMGAALVGWLYAALWTGTGDADVAVIAAPGNTTRTITLGGSGEIEIDGAIGSSTIIWNEQGIRFLHSPCAAKHCVHTGWLHRAGEVAACLPNGITIELRNGDQSYDGIAF